MSDVIRQGLMVTIIGMGLVFVVIIFLWWLMGLLVRVTTGKAMETVVEANASDTMDETLVPEMVTVEKQRRAAAAAVAVGVAIAQSCPQLTPGGQQAKMGELSPWQSLHRARGLEQKHKRG